MTTARRGWPGEERLPSGATQAVETGRLAHSAATLGAE